MAELGRGWTKALAFAVLWMGTGGMVYAQPGPAISNNATGSLSGRLTDLYSKPLEGVTITLRLQATGAVVGRSTSQKNGVYQFSGLEPGEYLLEAESAQLGRSQLEIAIYAGQESRLQTAVRFTPLAPDAALTAKQSEEPPATQAPPVVAAQHRIAPRLSFDHPSIEVAAPVIVNVTLEPEPLIVLPLSVRKLEVTATPSSTVPAPVIAAAPQLPAQSVTISTAATKTIVSASELQALPVSGRHWQDFVLDNAPTSATPAGGQAAISLRGAGLDAPVIALDGMSLNPAFGSTDGGHGKNEETPAGMAQVGVGGHGLAVSEAAIRRVETEAGNVEAEESRAAAGRMNMESERGANELHGQGFVFDRRNSWGAQNPFTEWVQESAPATLTTVPAFTPLAFTPPDNESTWGLGVCGHIRRDKLFWFAAVDGYQRNDPGVSMVKHPYLCANPPQCTEQTGFFAQPTNDQMQVLSAQLGVPSANPVAVGLAAYSPMLETLAGLLGPAPRTATQWTGFGRLDWQAAERHHFTVESIGAWWNSPGGGLTRVAENYGNHSYGSTHATEEWLLGRWEYFLTPNLLATTQGSVGAVDLEARPETPSAFEKSFLAGNLWGQLPQIVVDNRYGFTIGNPARFGQGSYPNEHLIHAQESVDWVRGKLLVRSGFEVDHNADETSLLRNQTGTYTYSNVENFATDALVFGKYGMSDALDPYNQHNCDQTGKVWRDSGGGLRGLGNLPCYSHYTQMIGPNDWHLSTNDWALYSTAQWQLSKRVVLSAGLRWEREQPPPALTAMRNSQLPLTEKLPALGNNWGPRLGLAVGRGEKHWPVLQLGYGLYYGRTENSTLEAALSQTGSLNGDLNYFLRPTDNLIGGGAPPFPYVLAGRPGSVIKPGAVEFAAVFRNPEVNQAIASAEEMLPGHVEVTAGVMVSLGRRLPISIDTNLATASAQQSITYNVVDPGGAGPIKATQITVPFYASWPGSGGDCPYYQPTGSSLAGRLCPDYQQITTLESRANSTYEAGILKVERYGRRGLSFHAHYIYGHAMDWNPNESAQSAGNDLLDPSNFGLEYGVSDLDIRHSFGATVVYETPWKLRGKPGKFANGWMISGVMQARSGLPFTMHTSGSLAKEFNRSSGAAIVGLAPGMNGSGGDNRVYGMGNDNHFYNIGRNTYRYPGTWKMDLRLGKTFDLGKMRQLELLAESFNLLNHQNVTELETTGYYLEPGSSDGALPTLNFMTGPMVEANGTIEHPNSTAFGQPFNSNATNFYRERQFQFGLRLRF